MPISIATLKDHIDIRTGVRGLCQQFDSVYWQKIDLERGYPEAFAQALTKAGWLAAMIPAEYGGAGLGLTEASIIMEEINHCGGNSGAVHGQMYNMSTLLHAGSAQQKQQYLPQIAAGILRLQSMAVTEPNTGSDTTKLKTKAERRGNNFIINGEKVWTSRVQHSDLMLVLARTTPLEQVKKKSDGLSVFLVDVAQALQEGMRVFPIANMVNHETNSVFFDDLIVPAENLIGDEGKGFAAILAGLNAERVLIAAECIGDARWFIEKASLYATDRRVFDRPIGANQGIQFPIAKSYAETEAADLMRYKAAALCDAGQPFAVEANMAKMLAADASFNAANVCIQTHGGYGFAVAYDIERKFRETRLYQVAPISTNLILAYLGEHVLGMPRSY